jgi:hypothetical protein
LPQETDPPAADEGVRVLSTDKNAGDSGSEQSVDARTCLSLVRAGFKGHIQVGAASGGSGCAQSEYFGVRLTGGGVMAFPDNGIVPNDHGPHGWIGPGSSFR